MIPVSNGARRGAALASWLYAALLLCGCETFNGRLYRAGTAPGFTADTRCEAIQPGSGSVVRVEVSDSQGGGIPGVTVRFRAVELDHAVDYVTDTHGLATAWIAPGQWRLEATLSGFYTGRYTLHLPAGEACTVRFQLRLKSQRLVSVAWNGKDV